ncbi:UNVERIFIED_CONTAM: hypothetical protein FKN15_006270 [Acipenser sinensis]
MSNFNWKPFVCGGLASVTAECGTFPIDLTKTRLQVQGQVSDALHKEIRYRGMVHALVRIYKEEGLKALYSGIAPAVLRQASYGTIKIGTYQSFKRLCVDSPEEESLPVNVLCGVLSGVISSSIANPTDVLKIRMQAQGRIMQGGMIGNFIDIYQQEGTRGLWKGVSLTAQRAAIVVGVELPVYDLTKKHLIKSGHMGDTVYTHFVLLTVFTKLTVTRLSKLDLNEKGTREKLSLWDRRSDALAPLTERQTDSILEIQAAAENFPIPTELPIEDLCSLTSRSISVPLTVTVPASTEDVLLQGFKSLGMEDERIETAQQFFSWFSKLQSQMDQDEGAKCRQTRDFLGGFQEQCDIILNDVNTALQHLESLQKQYLFVSMKTGTLHEACEQLLKEQSELVDLAESIQQKLSYFNELENINTKLNSSTLSVNSEGFVPMLAKLDDCIEYVSSHDPSGLPNAENAFTLFYVRFRASAPKVRALQIGFLLPVRYQQLLNEIHQCYLDQREQLLSPSITSTITDLTSQYNRDHCALV